MKMYRVFGYRLHQAGAYAQAGPFRTREAAERAALVILAKPNIEDVRIASSDEDIDDETDDEE